MCEIIPELHGNVSDHLPPPRKLFTLDVNIPMKAAKIQQDEALARPLWGDMERKNKYRDILQRKLENITLIKIDKQADLKTKQKLLDSHEKKISAMPCTKLIKRLDATQRNALNQRRSGVQRLRDKKKFWWRLWSTCGRPRSGTVYECYKDLKRRFRCIYLFMSLTVM